MSPSIVVTSVILRQRRGTVTQTFDLNNHVDRRGNLAPDGLNR